MNMQIWLWNVPRLLFCDHLHSKHYSSVKSTLRDLLFQETNQLWGRNSNSASSHWVFYSNTHTVFVTHTHGWIFSRVFSVTVCVQSCVFWMEGWNDGGMKEKCESEFSDGSFWFSVMLWPPTVCPVERRDQKSISFSQLWTKKLSIFRGTKEFKLWEQQQQIEQQTQTGSQWMEIRSPHTFW